MWSSTGLYSWPFALLLYINDMPESLNNTIPSLSADDTKIYASSHSSSDLIFTLKDDLKNISKWMSKNKL